MLESMRTHAQSWIARLLLWGIVLSFSLWGIGDYFLGSRVENVASIDGEPIHDLEFAQAYERETNSYRAIFGKNFSKKLMTQMHVRENTLQSLINRRLILLEANKLGMTTPDSAVLSEVEHNPAFQSGGSFDPARYRVMTRNMGFNSPEQYEAQLKIDLLATTLESSIMDSAPVTEAEIRAGFNRKFEKRVIAAVIVSPSSFNKKVHITETEAHAYYNAHKNDYRSPLRLVLNAVDISPKSIANGITIGNAELKKYYEKHKNEFMQPSERRASQILISITPSANKTIRTAALNKIKTIQAKLKAGVKFSTLAKTFSDDKGTAANGGDLGYFTKGTLTAAIDKAVFSMKLGQVSGVIKTPIGFHLIKLTGIKPASPKPFDAVKDQLETELAQSKARDEAYQLSQDLDDALGKNPELKDAAASLNLSVRHIGPISLQQAMADPLLSSDPGFRTKVFAMKPGDPVDVDDLSNGHYAAAEVMKRLEPAVLPFGKVTAQVYADAEQAAADKMAREAAEKLLHETSGKTVDQIAQLSGYPKYLSKPVLRSGAGGDNADWLNSSVLGAAFTTAKGHWVDHTIQTPLGTAIVQVDNVISPDAAEYAKQRPAIATEVAQSMGAARFARWMASVRAKHTIKVNKKALDRF